MNIKITWQLLVLVAILLAAVLASELLGAGDDKTIVLIVTAVLSGTIGPAVSASHTGEKLAQVQRSADQAVKQTNGVLDKRIRDGVTAVLAEHGVIDPSGPPAPAGKHAAPEDAG